MPVIAVDGPAASGKGTLAKRLAEMLGYHHLDTGLLYRAVGARLGSGEIDAASAEDVARRFDPVWLDDPHLRGEAAARQASRISAFPGVRAALLAFQRGFAHKAPGAVLDGRDIGTVVCPDAEAKLFVTASVEQRATRRFKELLAAGNATIYAAVLRDLTERDARDMARAASPLKPAEDALLIDSSGMTPEEVVKAALAWVRPRLG